MVGHFSNSSWIWLAMCTKWMHHAKILVGHFREMVRNWPVASCYFTLWVNSCGRSLGGNADMHAPPSTPSSTCTATNSSQGHPPTHPLPCICGRHPPPLRHLLWWGSGQTHAFSWSAVLTYVKWKLICLAGPLNVFLWIIRSLKLLLMLKCSPWNVTLDSL